MYTCTGTNSYMCLHVHVYEQCILLVIEDCYAHVLHTAYPYTTYKCRQCDSVACTVGILFVTTL